MVIIEQNISFGKPLKFPLVERRLRILFNRSVKIIQWFFSILAAKLCQLSVDNVFTGPGTGVGQRCKPSCACLTPSFQRLQPVTISRWKLLIIRSAYIISRLFFVKLSLVYKVSFGLLLSSLVNKICLFKSRLQNLITKCHLSAALFWGLGPNRWQTLISLGLISNFILSFKT